LRDAWDRNANEWIAWARVPGFDQYWRYHRDAFLSLVPSPGRLTLDLGCGEGRLLRDLTRLGHQVIGVDSSHAMTRAAVTHLDSGARVVQGDAACLPVGDATADCVIAFMSLQDVDDMENAVAECARVLVPRRHLVMAVTHPANTAGDFAEGDEEAERLFVIDGSWFERKTLTRHSERDGHTMTFVSEHRPLHDYTEALADVGFVIERIREVTEPDPSDKWHRIPLFLHIRAVLAERAPLD
jgi:SAM-dependent methyltransferase